MDKVSFSVFFFTAWEVLWNRVAGAVTKRVEGFVPVDEHRRCVWHAVQPWRWYG